MRVSCTRPYGEVAELCGKDPAAKYASDVANGSSLAPTHIVVLGVPYFNSLATFHVCSACSCQSNSSKLHALFWFPPCTS